MTRSRIAIVDDDQEIRDLLVDLLGGDGYDVTSLAGDEAHVVAELAAARPDVVILDLLLGAPSSPTSGWDLLHQLRRHAELHKVPILVCSADVRALRERQHEFARDPQVSALEKPFSVEALEQSVADLVVAHALPRWDDKAEFILVADDASNFVHATGAALEQLGLSLAELRQMQVADIVAYEREWTEREWNRYLAARAWEGPVSLLTRDGRTLDAHSRAEVVNGGSTSWHVAHIILGESVEAEPARP